ncbi:MULTISPECIES: NAD(P)/FAD-dependent oxidoreductase [unclassified Cyanobium]|uniref:NAD(P)/FAD-dependent oxidoreductase n=1 Tax=unclassified Cyanobium TaxID=2627006 RepID=UPI0020CB9E63|nr:MULTISPECIES: NAD(P)/FAD-dependent oxidoreductase [unclassified Cyanobium]MCP9859293.1 NAD(P)/FAD-dependent oxidoreductase [Cyanobium sp. Cruz-8H5]MCP9866681.1 NAD(P)/FAD-dependent oxidoreductase [Cyanobium sp. Cruz-8D1]
MPSESSLRCQVLVVGAGPAGGDLARRLALQGVDVVLVDRLSDLSRSAFSSAALPIETMEAFGLPAEVVGSRWRQWQLIGPGSASRSWASPQPLGVVLDFGALRHWQADQCRRWGGRVQLGLHACSSHQEGERMVTVLRRSDGRTLRVSSDWTVDASGQARALLGDPPPAQRPRDGLVGAAGLEWLLRVSPACWERWADRLSFCLGSDWVPQGYGWIFPMQPGVLKLGVCRLLDPQRQQPPLGGLITELGRRLLEPGTGGAAFEVLDRHGGLVRSTIRRRELHQRGRLVGLGDAVSTANLLGGEGIRHALSSSAVLAPLLQQALAASGGQASAQRALQDYAPQLRRALGWRWSLSGRLARRTWLGLHGPQADGRLDQVLKGLERRRAEDLSALLFGYRFERYGLRAMPYLLGWR